MLEATIGFLTGLFVGWLLGAWKERKKRLIAFQALPGTIIPKGTQVENTEYRKRYATVKEIRFEEGTTND